MIAMCLELKVRGRTDVKHERDGIVHECVHACMCVYTGMWLLLACAVASVFVCHTCTSYSQYCGQDETSTEGKDLSSIARWPALSRAPPSHGVQW